MTLRIPIRVGGVPEHFNLPWQLAEEYGILEKKNIKLDWTFYPNGTGAMVKDLAENKLDLAVLLTEGAVNAIVNGIDAKLIKMYVNTPLIWGIHTGKNSTIKNIGEAEGKKIAISRFGSGSHLMPMVDAFYRKKEINKNQFVVIENMAKAITSLNSAESDIFYWEKYTTKPYVDSKEIKRIGEYLTPWPCFVIAGRTEFIKKHKHQIRILLDSIAFVCEQFMKSPDTAIPLLVERFKMKEEDAYDWYYATEWSSDYSISEKMLQNVQYILEKTGNIKQSLSKEELTFKL